VPIRLSEVPQVAERAARSAALLTFDLSIRRSILRIIQYDTEGIAIDADKLKGRTGAHLVLSANVPPL
jgi:hypothetical protein